jgi:hypothetical protein
MRAWVFWFVALQQDERLGVILGVRQGEKGHARRHKGFEIRREG